MTLLYSLAYDCVKAFSFQTAAVLFERLLDILRRLAKQIEELNKADPTKDPEAAKVASQLEEARNRLLALLKQLRADGPSPSKDCDEAAYARKLEMAICKLLQRLKDVSISDFGLLCIQWKIFSSRRNTTRRRKSWPSCAKRSRRSVNVAIVSRSSLEMLKAR